MTSPTPHLDAKTLQKLAQAVLPQKCACSLGPCAGWESVTEDRWPAHDMTAVGSLREVHDLDGNASGGEPTFEEFHPQGTRYDSAQAPIAPLYYPCNRCDVFACNSCQRLLLRYTEFGGYYVDHRVRALQAALVVDAPLPGATV